MCGIAGLLDSARASSGDELEALAAAMATTLAHRGPDDHGVFTFAPAGVALGFRRLAVVDLSTTGHQPMTSASGRYTIVTNGEVYNHRALRAELSGAGAAFRGRSDTEVLLEAIDRWGLVPALRKVNGMFAAAVWDGTSRTLALARDRIGEKPLYYGRAGRHFVFASELKALRAHPWFAPAVDRDALAEMLRLTFVPGPHSIYEGVRKLLPGTVLTLTAGSEGLPEPVAYWSLGETVAAGRTHPFTGDAHEAEEALASLLGDAVSLRLQADVPVGTFLSGGIDSSLVAALAAERAAGTTGAAGAGGVARTYTVAMPEAGFDERAAARAVAERLGTVHTELELSPADVLGAIPSLPEVYDEPFADPSQLPTTLVARAARREVTAALSGDGGDELFGGYNRYVLGAAAWRRTRRIPPPVRGAAARALLAVRPGTVDALAARTARLLPGSLQVRNPGDKAQKLARLLRSRNEDDVYRALVSAWEDPPSIVLGRPPSDGHRVDGRDWAGAPTPIERMMAADTATSLPDGMLTKVDRATMAVALEARLPLLDHRVVELAWRLPLDLKVRDDQGKWILRRLLDRYVPRNLVDRPKMGFDPPIGAWLRGPLREWAGDLLAPSTLAAQGFLRPEPIRARWAEHLDGRRNWDYSLWAVLMFQAWIADQ